MAATVYILATNGIDHSVTYTSRAKAVETAQVYVWGAQESKEGEHHISVRTQKTGKIIFDETVSHVDDMGGTHELASCGHAAMHTYSDGTCSRCTAEYSAWLETQETATDAQSLCKFCDKPVHGATLCAPVGNVMITGEYTEHPDAFRHMAEQDAARIMADGGCVGLCAVGTGCEHCDAEYGPTASETAAQTPSEDSVEIHGAEEFDATPDMSVLTGECYYGCGRPVTGMWCDYVGRTEGVCDLDRDELGNHITVVPVDPAIWGGAPSEGVATVCVIQNTPGMNGRSHYHAPGCRDIAIEMKRHSARKGLGMYEFPFASVAEILAFEYGDIASSEAESGTSEWWAEILYNAQTDKSLGADGFGVKIMPCLVIPMGDAGDSPLVMVNGEFRIGETMKSPVMDDQTSYNVDSHTRYPNGRKGEDDTTALSEVFEPGTRVVSKATGDMGTVVQPYMTGVIEGIGTRMSAVTMTMDDGSKQSALIGALDIVTDGPWIDPECGCERHANPSEVPCPEHGDAGFVETTVTKEYELSVVVDESTGASVSLGWVTLTMNAAQYMDWDRVAEEYGRTYGEGTPRHGWASIIRVHDVCDL